MAIQQKVPADSALGRHSSKSSTKLSTEFVDNDREHEAVTGPIVGVAIDAPLRRLFDYRAPHDVDCSSLRPGQRVWVPFGRRKTVGVIVEIRDRSDIAEPRLKRAIARIDDEPVLDLPLLELLRWSAEYYRHPLGEVVSAALPAALRGGGDALATAERWVLSAAARAGTIAPLGARELAHGV